VSLLAFRSSAGPLFSSVSSPSRKSAPFPARERVVPEVADDDIVAVVAAHLVVFPALDDPGI
jgi:hypothetical protein